MYREMLDKLIEDIAGIITALATGATAVLMWHSNRREAAREGPIVECDVSPRDDGLLRAEFTIRNRMAESLIVGPITIRPRGVEQLAQPPGLRDVSSSTTSTSSRRISLQTG
jgi:hypothetical protein